MPDCTAACTCQFDVLTVQAHRLCHALMNSLDENPLAYAYVCGEAHARLRFYERGRFLAAHISGAVAACSMREPTF